MSSYSRWRAYTGQREIAVPDGEYGTRTVSTEDAVQLAIGQELIHIPSAAHTHPVESNAPIRGTHG
jgi:hypothetical protein